MGGEKQKGEYDKRVSLPLATGGNVIERIREKVRSEDLRAVLAAVAARSAGIEELRERNQRKMMENRAKREGISVEAIERQVKRAMGRHVPSARERGEMEEVNRKRLEQGLTDEELFRWVWMIVDMEGLVWRELAEVGPEENAGLVKALVDAYGESQRILRECAVRHGWEVPAVFGGARKRMKGKRG